MKPRYPRHEDAGAFLRASMRAPKGSQLRAWHLFWAQALTIVAQHLGIRDDRRGRPEGSKKPIRDDTVALARMTETSKATGEVRHYTLARLVLPLATKSQVRRIAEAWKKDR